MSQKVEIIASGTLQVIGSNFSRSPGRFLRLRRIAILSGLSTMEAEQRQLFEHLNLSRYQRV